MSRLPLLITLVITFAVIGALGSHSDARPLAAVSGEWIGTYTLAGRGPVPVTVRLAGARAVVALGVGHADTQSASAKTAAGRLRFSLPGRPGALSFDGRLRRGLIMGSTRQGTARGTFRLLRGRAPAMVARGYFGGGAMRRAVLDDPFGPPRVLDLETGEVHGLFGAGPAFTLGSGWSTPTPVTGTARIDSARATISGSSLTRRAVRQLEVRFPSGRVVLSGTLTLPPGAGPHPAVAFVTGSGRTERAYLPDLHAVLVDSGVAVLVYDKRGVAQSGGNYPGESPTESTIDTLAVDAQAAVRWLARQPEVDAARVGLAGHSQAGWIMPLAATREPAARFMIVYAGPAVTADETDYFQDLTGQGESVPTLTDDQIEAEVERRGPSGVDPIPWIRAVRIPALWLYGGLDRHIPSRMSTRRLQPIAAEAGRDFTITSFPQANHALVQTQTGLTAEMVRSDRLAPGLFPAVRAWLRARGLGAG